MAGLRRKKAGKRDLRTPIVGPLLNLVLKKSLGVTRKMVWLAQSIIFCLAMRKSKQLQNNFIHTHIH